MGEWPSERRERRDDSTASGKGEDEIMQQPTAEEIRETKNRNMRQLFAGMGMQYYITARYCYFAQLNPVSANQFHHAIEMRLKSALWHRLSGEDHNREPEGLAKNLKNNFVHNLPKMWRAFKSTLSDSTLDQFDAVVSGLHKFENIRYPDELAFKGGIIQTGFEDTDIGQTDDSEARPEPEYQFSLVPIDRLVKVILEKSSINPSFFTGSLHREAGTYLLRENEVPYETRANPVPDI